MAVDPLSVFVCSGCGFEKRSDTVPYDGLGYPVCPTCGSGSQPTLTT